MLEMHILGAAATLVETMQSKTVSADTRLKATLALLDRTGFKPVEKHEHKVTDVLGMDDLARLRQANDIHAMITAPVPPILQRLMPLDPLDEDVLHGADLSDWADTDVVD
jgi:hypothetical protein